MSREQDLIEANRRGLLKGKVKADFDAAVERGLIKLPSTQEDGIDVNLMRGDSPGQQEARGSAPFTAKSVAEPLATIMTGAVAEPVAGVAGIAQSLNPFAEEGAGAKAVKDVREELTFQPRSDSGQEALTAVAETVGVVADPINKAVDTVADFALEVTNSPLIATGVKVAPAAAMELLGLGALRKVKAGTRLKTPDGLPTKTLRKELNRQGLVYENLKPEIQQSIPVIADKRLIPGGNEAKGAAEAALVDQIKLGGTDDSLAALKVKGDRVVNDIEAAEAIRQGFDPGSIQAIKGATPETRQSMKKMLDITRQIQSNRRVGLDVRPTSVVGESLGKRINFLRDDANQARLELNNIADSELRGAQLDAAPIVSKLEDSLNKLDVDLISDNGVPSPVFEGSLISKDRTSQRVIKDLIGLMSEGGTPDALRFHKLKRQLDTLIDFNRKSASGLTEAGKGVLKDIRSELNNSLRASNPAYAAVNDRLSSSLSALDEFQKVSGSSIDIFGPKSTEAIGQDLRGLMSNRKSRVRLENSIDGIERAVSDIGGEFSDNIKDLVLFSNTLDDRFGAVARTSLKGEIESVVNRAGTQGVKTTVLDAVVGKVAEGADKLRGVNDFNAFESMTELLNRTE